MLWRYVKKTNFYFFLISLVIILVFSFSIPFFLVPQKIGAESWLVVGKADEEKIWVDTSHWEKKQILVKSGYYKEIPSKRWIDTSYTVSQGHWETGQHKVWVTSSEYVPYTAYRYVDTSHYETEYYYVDVYKPVNFTAIKGTDSYGWSVYSFAAKTKGMQQVTYNGSKYLAVVYVINYKPARGGQIYAEKYVFLYKIVKELHSKKVLVKTGYWQPYTDYKKTDTSHWETKYDRYWIDTSYKVDTGYWEDYTGKQWIDTSHYEYMNVLIKSGYYSEPLHGKIKVEKSPKYVFTRWHKNEDGESCGMDLKIIWELDNGDLEEGSEPEKISEIRVYQNTVRYKDNGTDKKDLFSEKIKPADAGSVSFFSEFDFAGDWNSVCHIYLFAEDGKSVHAYFANPINGFGSINIKYEGTAKNADIWSGGNDYGEAIF
jgi:hypothetical protein